ncbi:WD_REPEATS_REGION domain-containing protein [Linnemannia zychae]|nr:WD_REPEATS_REGION domain-containing protein [Linnemannia zychae]
MAMFKYVSTVMATVKKLQVKMVKTCLAATITNLLHFLISTPDLFPLSSHLYAAFKDPYHYLPNWKQKNHSKSLVSLLLLRLRTFKKVLNSMVTTYMSEDISPKGTLKRAKAALKDAKKIADVYSDQRKILLGRGERVLALHSAENEALWVGHSGESSPTSSLFKLFSSRRGSKTKSIIEESQDEVIQTLDVTSTSFGTTGSSGASPSTSPQPSLQQTTSIDRSIAFVENIMNPVSKTPEISNISNNNRSRPARTGSKASLLRAGSDVKLKYKPANPTTTLLNGNPSGSTTSNTSAPPTQMFLQDTRRPVIDIPVPDLRSRFESTTQLAFCANLLFTPSSHSLHSSGPSPDYSPAWQSWKASAETTEGEKDRIGSFVQKVVIKFINDPIKDTAAFAEVLRLGPVLDREHYRRLLSCLIAGFEAAKLLDEIQLRGFVRLVQSAPFDYVDLDDLVRILVVLKTRLQETHTQSNGHGVVLAWAICRLLDVMVKGDVKALDRVLLDRVLVHKPLSDLLDQVAKTSDPYLEHQALYASQALLFIPDDETRWQCTRRHIGRITMGLLGIASVCKLDLGKFEEGVDHLWEALGDAHEVATKVIDGFEAEVESGKGILESIRNTFLSGAKQLWYTALKEAEECIFHGRLEDFNHLIFKAPCRRHIEYRWGVCQLLSDIVFDPHWDTATHMQAINLLGALYRNEVDWKRNDRVNRGILDILRHAVDLGTTEVRTCAQKLLSDLRREGEDAKQKFYRACMSDRLHHLLSRDPFATELTSKLLSQAQSIPEVEDELLKLKDQRLEKCDSTLYIPPQARTSCKSSSGTKTNEFPLMEKTMEFLLSNQEVFLLQGDSGAGKSTFNRQLECLLWKDYKMGGPIPLHINLPGIVKPEQDMIAKQLQIYNFTVDQIQELKEHRRFILICDGYDESQIKVNLHISNRLNQRGQWQAKVVISCRTQYLGAHFQGRFQPSTEHYSCHTVERFQQATLAPFSKIQIQQYVKQYVKQSSHEKTPVWTFDDYMDKFRRIPHLLDLVSNPFLLTLALEALPALVDTHDDLESITVTRVALYDNFVDRWLEAGQARLEHSLPSEARTEFQQLVDDGFAQQGITFAMGLAEAIYKNQRGISVVQYSDLADGQSWKAKFFGPSSCLDHLRMSLPLLRNGKQNRFLHRSLLEYFYSRIFFNPPPSDIDDCQDPDEELSVNHQRNPILEHPLNQPDMIPDHSVFEFLAERVNTHPKFANLLHAMVNESKTNRSVSRAAANAMTILVKAGVRFNGKDLRSIKIQGADLSGGEFDWTNFQGADLRDVNLTRTWLRQANLQKATMSGVQFGELPYLTEDDQVWSCAYSLDRERLATGCRNGTVNIYSTASWKKIQSLPLVSTKPIHGLAFSPDSQQLATACEDHRVRIWKLGAAVFQLQHTLKGHSKGVRCVAYSPDGRQLASCSMDKTVILWDPIEGKACAGNPLKGHTDGIYSLAYSRDGQAIATASADNTVRLWNVQPTTFGTNNYANTSGRIVGRHSKHVVAISFSPTEPQIASGCSDGTVVLWNIGGEESACILKLHTEEVWSLAYSPNGRQIATGSQDLTIRVWDTHTGDAIFCLDGHSKGVYCVRYSPLGDQIASASQDGNVRLWNTASYSSATSHHKRAGSVAFSPAGCSVLSAINDGSLCLRDANASHSRAVFRGHNPRVWHAAFSPDGSRIVSGGSDKTIRIWSTETKKSLRLITGHGGGVTCVAFSPSGRQVASCSFDKTVRLWDSESGKRGMVLEGHTNKVNCVVYSPTKPQLASGSADKTIMLWNTDSGKCDLVIKDLVNSVLSIAFSPDGERILHCSGDAFASIRKTTQGEVCGNLKCKDSKITTAAYSPSGELIATGGYDNSLRLWDAKSLECLLVIGGVSGFANGISVAWSPVINHLRLATVSSEGIIYQWEVVKDYGSEDVKYHMRLVWGSRRQGLFLEGVQTQGAIGLNPVISELFKQRVAGYQATAKKKNKKKKKTSGGTAQ